MISDQMKKKLLAITFFLLLSTALLSYTVENVKGVQPAQNSTNYYEGGFRYNVQGWVYIHLEGDPYERGYQYGYLASAEILDALCRWSGYRLGTKHLKIFTIKTPEQWWNICRKKAMNTFLKQIPEEYKQELKGMTDGILARDGMIFGRNVEFDDIVALQFVQEIDYIYGNFRKGFHPVRDLIYGLKEILSGSIVNHENGHCNAFIATGDATSDGGIVVAHASIFPVYVAERCNIILDVQPSEGYRFMMTSPPGSLWSQEDYYQNEKGIILTETELAPQGPWKTRGTSPKGVRSRNAIQYSNSIDEVIENLKKGNNGLIPNEWLIGDTKTGEIASYMQALYNTPIKRTFNGYYWSCNLPTNVKVLSELNGIPQILLRVYGKIFSKGGYFTIDGETVIWNNERPETLIELGEQYYGKIDTEIAKQIMSTPPLPKPTTDCKITDSKLMENMGLLAHMGKSDGVPYIPSEKDKDRFSGVTELPPNGWLELYPSKSKPNNLPLTEISENEADSCKILWQSEINGMTNMNYSSIIVSEKIVCAATSGGDIYALDASSGSNIWASTIGTEIVEPTASKDLVFFGTDKGLHAINKENGNIEWEQFVGRISSKPVIAKNQVVVGCSNGDVYVFDVDSGDIKCTYRLSDSAYVSEINTGDILYVGSGKTCYAVDVVNEELLWEYETDGVVTASPKNGRETVYFGSWDGNLYALDADTGNLKWKYRTGWGIDITPAASDGMLFVGSLDNNFYALDANSGELEWYFTCKSAIHSSPVTYGEYVFFGCDDGRLYALNKTNGDLAWSFAPGYFIKDNDVNNYITTPILSSPFIDNGVVYIGAKGIVYALDAQTVEIKPEPIEEPFFSEYALFISLLSLFIVFLLISFLIRRYYRKK